MNEQKSYQVLARKYRPNVFEELIGQEVLVRTLTNAILNKKIAHAFILTGIRGIGKTTTARIIAKALNCLGKDEAAIEAMVPCGICSNCISIAASKFQDVIEIDAASRTGVDDIREIIDSIGYAPAIGRYKTYIIDEVHMLSNNAFNALLKTLEEPPAHTKFIFATTEIRKVPITVLSRCQRFDLRRLNNQELSTHLENILKKENYEAEKKALDLIANAAEGSVRDSLSILDRALSHNNYEKILSTKIVEEILNLTDKSKVLELFENLIQGQIETAIKNFAIFYENGADVISLTQDLLDINHKITLCKTLPAHEIEGFSKEQQEKINEIASKISIASLAKFWQMLLKGITELNYAANQKNAFEMLLVRICYLSDLPNLEQVINQMNSTSKSSTAENFSSPKKSPNNDIAAEIMRNFSGAKIVS